MTSLRNDDGWKLVNSINFSLKTCTKKISSHTEAWLMFFYIVKTLIQGFFVAMRQKTFLLMSCESKDFNIMKSL